MIEGAEALLTLAEFAVALAGFMGVVMVFRRADAEFHPVDSHRIQVGLAATLGPAFLALLPAGLGLAGVPSPLVWRICSAVGALFVIAYLVFEARGRRRVLVPVRSLFSGTVVRILHVLLGVSLALLLINLSGFWLEPRSGLYFLALVLPVCFGALAFVRIVFIRPGGAAV